MSISSQYFFQDNVKFGERPKIGLLAFANLSNEKLPFTDKLALLFNEKRMSFSLKSKFPVSISATLSNSGSFLFAFL